MATTIFAKLDADIYGNPKIQEAGAEGLAVFVFVLVKNAARGATGSIPARYLRPDFLARTAMLSPEAAERGIASAIAADLIAVDGDQVVIVGWDAEHGRGPLSARERKQVSRARSKGQEIQGESRNVTIDRDASDESHAESDRRDRSRGHVGHVGHTVEESRVEESRGDRRDRRDVTEPVTAPEPTPPPEAPAVEPKRGPGTGPERATRRAEARRLFALQEQLRREVDPGARPTAQIHCEDTITVALAHHSAETLEHVLRVFAGEARALPAGERLRWFNGVGHWKTDAIERAKDLPVPGAARTPVEYTPPAPGTPVGDGYVQAEPLRRPT